MFNIELETITMFEIWEELGWARRGLRDKMTSGVRGHEAIVNLESTNLSAMDSNRTMRLSLLL